MLLQYLGLENCKKQILKNLNICFERSCLLLFELFLTINLKVFPKKKIRKWRNTWSNTQIWPWYMEWSTAKANRVLPREHTGHNKHLLPTTQEKTLHIDITRWPTSKSDWLYSLQPKMEKQKQVSKNKARTWRRLRSWTTYCWIQM